MSLKSLSEVITEAYRIVENYQRTGPITCENVMEASLVECLKDKLEKFEELKSEFSNIPQGEEIPKELVNRFSKLDDSIIWYIKTLKRIYHH